MWRGYRARQYVKEMYKTLRRRVIRRNRAAAEIQQWYRGCLLIRQAQEELQDLRYHQQCALRFVGWSPCQRAVGTDRANARLHA
jgi:hypothetical protein